MLHQRAAPADEPRHLTEAEHTGGDQRRVLAETVAGEPLRFEAELLAQHREHRDLRGENAGLRELGQVQPLVVAKGNCAEIGAASIGSLGERRARDGKLLVEILRHAGALRALAGEHQGSPMPVAHPNTPFSRRLAMSSQP